MNGIKIKELYELISHWHEIEFEYNETTYVLQPEVNEQKTHTIYDTSVVLLKMYKIIL